MKLHQDSRPMDIDQDHIFVDKTMGVKKALDETKNDFADRTPGTPTAERPIGPLWLRVIKGLATVRTISSTTLTPTPMQTA